MTGRTFVVSVTDSPPRVVVEDVQGRQHALAADLADAALQIGRWLASPPPGPPRQEEGQAGDVAGA